MTTVDQHFNPDIIAPSPDEGLLLSGGLAAAAFRRPTWRWVVGGTKPVEAGAEEGALP